MEGFVASITGASGDFLSYLEESGKLGAPFDISPDMAKLTLDVAGRAFFGLNIWDKTDALVQAVNDTGEMGQNLVDNPFAPPIWVPTRVNRTARKGLQVMYDTIDELIDEGEKRGIGDDLLSKLLEHVNNGDMTRSHLREEMWTLVNAGHETTATTLSAVFHHLGKYPQLKQKVIAEVDAVLGSRPPTFENLVKLDLTTRLVMETLRLYPPAFGTGREILADDVVNEYRIPKGGILQAGFFYTQMDERHWDQPETFDPDRFLATKSESRHPLAFVPFGAGGRRCVGEHFALIEAVIVTAMTLQRYDIDKEPDFELEPHLAVALRFKTGSRVILNHREQLGSQPGDVGMAAL
jgi:cytochrome P450